jgi:hypothetical protein
MTLGCGTKNVGVKETQAARLHRAAHKKLMGFDRVRQIRNQGLANFAFARAVQDQAKRALFIMLANQDDGSMEKRPV